MNLRLSSNKNRLAIAKEKIVKNLLKNAIRHRLRQIAMYAIAEKNQADAITKIISKIYTLKSKQIIERVTKKESQKL
jgi:hypothetical protein